MLANLHPNLHPTLPMYFAEFVTRFPSELERSIIYCVHFPVRLFSRKTMKFSTALSLEDNVNIASPWNRLLRIPRYTSSKNCVLFDDTLVHKIQWDIIYGCCRYFLLSADPFTSHTHKTSSIVEIYVEIYVVHRFADFAEHRQENVLITREHTVAFARKYIQTPWSVGG